MIAFDEFWRNYPRKVGRMKAEKSWSKLVYSEQKLALEGLAMWSQSVDWRDPLYIPHASTFLNQRRWEDEPIIYKRPSERRNPAQEQMERDRQDIAEILKRHPDLA